MAQQTTCKILNKHGLHARPAAMLVKTASQFESDIQIEKSGTKVNAKSIMSIMMLAAGMDSELTIHADGSDEQDALTAISDLITGKFGEE